MGDSKLNAENFMRMVKDKVTKSDRPYSPFARLLMRLVDDLAFITNATSKDGQTTEYRNRLDSVLNQLTTLEEGCGKRITMFSSSNQRDASKEQVENLVGYKKQISELKKDLESERSSLAKLEGTNTFQVG